MKAYVMGEAGTCQMESLVRMNISHQNLKARALVALPVARTPRSPGPRGGRPSSWRFAWTST